MPDQLASGNQTTFYRNIGVNAIARSEQFIMTKDNEDNIRGIAWNPVEKNEEYMLVTKLVDEYTCNPLKTWIDMGSPACPKKDQSEELHIF